jgi:hypothetical protein
MKHRASVCVVADCVVAAIRFQEISDSFQDCVYRRGQTVNRHRYFLPRPTTRAGLNLHTEVLSNSTTGRSPPTLDWVHRSLQCAVGPFHKRVEVDVSGFGIFDQLDSHWNVLSNAMSIFYIATKT